MARPQIRLDIGGMREMRNSPGVRALLESLGDRVAAAAEASPEVQRNGMEVWASRSRRGPNRASAIVTIAHPGGLAVQAKHGTLTRAVAQAGLPNAKVRRR